MTSPMLAANPITHSPIWPWSTSSIGMLVLLITAGLLLGVTIWTYLRVPHLSLPRALAIITIRGLAILMVFASLMGTSCITDKEYNRKSLVLIGIDATKSESIVQDEQLNGLSVSRWERAKALIQNHREQIKELEEKYNLKFVFYRFGDSVAPYDLDNPGNAEAMRTDHYQFLNFVYNKSKPRDSDEMRVRAFFIIGDGADNRIGGGSIQQVMKKWKRDVQAPVVVIPLGKSTTPDDERDVVLKSLIARQMVIDEKTRKQQRKEIRIKGRLPVEAEVDALGFLGKSVKVRIFIDDVELTSDQITARTVNGAAVDSSTIVLGRTKKNKIEFDCLAPATPGEYKLTMKIEDPVTGKALPGELSEANNEMGTFVTVTKGGLSVLVVERQERFPEPQVLLPVLELGDRISAFRLWVRGAAEISEKDKDIFDFKKRPYDVIILGDVSATRLKEVNQGQGDILQILRDKVEKEGVGLLMMGGDYTFGNTDENGGRNWKGTPIEDLLPVNLNEAVGQVVIDPRDTEAVRNSKGKLIPEDKGLIYVLKVAGTREESEKLWKKLPILDGHSKLGSLPDSGRALLFASTQAGGPLLVGQDYGKGRVMAFGGDTTYRWRRADPLEDLTLEEGVQAHENFWRQVVFWLAKQEELDEELSIDAKKRRLPVGEILKFDVGLRGKDRSPIQNATFKVKVIDPEGKSTVVRVTSPTTQTPGTRHKQEGSYKPLLPGEYRIEVEGNGSHPVTKAKVAASKSLRFLSFQDAAETTQRAANHEFLKQLSKLGGGKLIPVLDEEGQQKTDDQGNPMVRAPYAAEFGKMLEEYGSKPPPRDREIELWPDWRTSDTPSAFLIGFFLIFVQLLALEWFLRKRWGLT